MGVSRTAGASPAWTKWGSTEGAHRRGEARRAEARDPKGRERVWSSWGSQTPSPPARESGERCKLPKRCLGRRPGRRRVFLHSVPPDCLSWHLNTCCTAWFLPGETYVLVTEFRGIALNDLLCADVLRPHDRVPSLTLLLLLLLLLNEYY